MRRIFCDRCGKEINSNCYHKHQIIDRTQGTVNFIDKQFDLCNECYIEFKDFMKRKE